MRVGIMCREWQAVKGLEPDRADEFEALAQVGLEDPSSTTDLLAAVSPNLKPSAGFWDRSRCFSFSSEFDSSEFEFQSELAPSTGGIGEISYASFHTTRASTPYRFAAFSTSILQCCLSSRKQTCERKRKCQSTWLHSRER
jgi:hypothetical protein